MKNVLKIAIIALVMSTSSASALPEDKIGHALTGMAAGSFIASATKSPALGCMAATAGGAAKEIHDMMGYGTPDFADFLFTAIPGCIASSIFKFEIENKGLSSDYKYDQMEYPVLKGLSF